MDAVIAYVNGCEKVWRTECDKHCYLSPTKYIRFYDWGTLRYVLRGISTYMPYIKNVFLIVSNIEQIPDYVDQSKVKIVLHKDFIPEEFLPTFQANTIELYIHNIPGLDEEFIYFNDDMIPMNPIAYNDLISNGKPCMSFVENFSDPHMISYYFIRNSFRAACKYVTFKNTYNSAIMDNPILYRGPGISHIHSPIVFLKSKTKDIFNFLYDEYENFSRIITMERNAKNLSQYVYSDVYYLENSYVGSRLTLKYIQTNEITGDNISDKILSTNTNYLCINDFGKIIGYTYKESAEMLQSVLNTKFKRPCKYEYDGNE